MVSGPTHLYIGRAECGCIVAATVDFQDKSTGEDVAEFIASGYVVERIAGTVQKLGHTCGRKPSLLSVNLQEQSP